MEWFYAQSGRQNGPVSESDLLELSRGGVVTQETLVWHEGMSEWQPYRLASSSFETPQRYCNTCGNRFPASDLAMFGDSAVCAACKPAYVQRLAQGMASTEIHRFEYAGFWIRFVAYVIDAIIMSAVRYMITLPLGLETFIRPLQRGFNWGFVGWATGIGTLVHLAYCTWFWTQRGATPGKMIFGLKVVRPDGSLISTGQAIGRFFCYFIDWFILAIGFMMAGWDDQKRALHDRICETRVIRTR
jgi:uncharacterized RDD family membrane protein YckC